MTLQVLLICADQRRATRVQVALLRYGYMVEVAGTFRRGLAIIEHRPPTAIVIDESLPGLDDRLLAQVLAAKSASSRPAVVILPLDTCATSHVIEVMHPNASPSPDVTGCAASSQNQAQRL
jgi:DNA-binding response OmpR family regulator